MVHDGTSVPWKRLIGGKPVLGENLRAVVESSTRFGMKKLLFYEKPSVGGKPLLGKKTSGL